MYVRPVLLNALIILLLCSAGGCKKSEPAKTEVPAAAGEVIARIHWLGKRQISAEANATGLMRLWNRAESTQLEAQTLDRLSTAPWRLLLHQSELNPASSLLRPLLDDLVQGELLIEMSLPTNQPAAFVMALHAGDKRTALWRTNLAEVLKSLTGITPSASPDGWVLQKHDPPDVLQFKTAGGWALFAGGGAQNPLLDDMVSRIQRQKTPVPSSRTNFWLQTDLDLTRVAQAFSRGWQPPQNFPLLSLSMIGDGENVRTRGSLSFTQGVPLKVQPNWAVPTNTIRDPLVSFTAFQTTSELWKRLERLTGIKIEPTPNEAYVWALAQIPFQTFFTVGVTDAQGFIQSLAPQVIASTARFSTNMGGLVVATNPWSMIWTGMPFATPYLRPALDAGHEYVFGGIFPNSSGTNTAPAELLQQVSGRTNLVYYDWEITQYRLLQWRYLDDLFHIVWDPTRKPRLRGDMAGMRWLGNIVTNLGNSVTEVTITDSNTLAVVRNSSIGFTGFELESLVNWLETPEFPGFPRSLLSSNTTLRVSPVTGPPRH